MRAETAEACYRAGHVASGALVSGRAPRMGNLFASPLPDGTSSYLGRVARAALLTREGEIETVRQIGAYRLLADIERRRMLRPVAEHSPRQVGGRFGVTRDRIRQSEAKALGRPRRPSGNPRSSVEG
jgi:hypothetical protein